MSYSISLSDDRKYLRVTVKKPVSYELTKEFARAAITRGKQHNIDRFLVDVRGMPNIKTSTQHYILANQEVPSLQMSLTSKIAVLISKGDRTHDFTETVYRNAGYECLLFIEEEKAIHWLEQ